MNSLKFIPLEEVMVRKRESVDPTKHPNEVFDLYSIPAYDSQKPERLLGSEIGSAKKMVQIGDVLLSRIVPHIRRAWVVSGSNGHRQIGSGEWMIFSDRMVWPSYLRHLLTSDWFHPKLMQTVSGVGGSLLRARPAEVARIEIPIPHKNGKPDLEEQKRIAAILDKADAIRRKRQQALRLTDDFLRSLFLDMFGDPVTNPKGWEQNISLGSIADIVSGITKGRKLNGQRVQNVPYLAVANVQDKRLALESVKSIDATDAEIERFQLSANDLLLTEGGDPDKLGRGTLWKGEIPVCIHQNHVFRVRLTDRRVDPVYLNWLVGSERGKKYFLRSAKQTTGIASINMTQLRAFPMLLPPIGLQRQFAGAVSKAERLVSMLSSQTANAASLFSTLQQRAFRGEL